MRLRFLEGAERIAAGTWDALFPSDYPFTRHAFLLALERHGCVTPRCGWAAHHAVLEDAAGTVAAVAPLYLKAHSYGEFVFDFSWAQASHRLGHAYYPKWLVAIPFTPSTGPRVGAATPQSREQMVSLLAEAFEKAGASSLHALFLDAADVAAATQADGLPRHDIQFHWHNRGYRSFEDFVGQLSSDKRKKILRERRRVAEAGIRFEWCPGDALSEAEWISIYHLYSNTYEERGQSPYLTLEFFLNYARKPGSPFKLMLAYEDARMVAVAITLEGGDTLYGRHWGAAEHYHSLHFETCYYQGIEYCLKQGLKRFDAGAQGEHKLARGFEPVVTQSAHWLSEPRLRGAVRHALEQERRQIAAMHHELLARSPFRASGPCNEGT
jgi:predicted N-acyltransferase